MHATAAAAAGTTAQQAVRQQPRVPASAPGTLEVVLRSGHELTAKGGTRVSVAVSIRDVSLSGLSLVFLDANFSNSAGTTAQLEPSRDMAVTVRFHAGGRAVALPAQIVWHKRLPTTRQLLFAGVKLNLHCAGGPNRRIYEEWVRDLMEAAPTRIHPEDSYAHVAKRAGAVIRVEAPGLEETTVRDALATGLAELERQGIIVRLEFA